MSNILVQKIEDLVDIKKDSRKDISNYTATFKDDSTISFEASTKSEAQSKVEEYLESLSVES